MSLYFIITPLIQYFGDQEYLVTRLAATEGLPRMIWVAFCVAVGISAFFLAYFKTKPGQPKFGLPQDSWPLGTWGVLVLMLLGAFYTLIKYRGSYGFTREAVLIVGSKFVGNITGYEYVMHYFASFPIALLILRRSTRVLGFTFLVLYLLGRLGDAWDRQSAVSLLLGVTMIVASLRSRLWPPRRWIALVLAFTLLMAVRGHLSFTEAREYGMFTKQNIEAEVKKGEGASMLATLYLSTYMYDKAGYSYGVPLVSGLLFGALPRKYFPWKDWLALQVQPDYKKIRNPEVFTMMYGAKDSVMGDLYGNGNIVGIVLGMLLLGFLVRKLDGWVASEAPVTVRAMGFIWMGSLWLIFGSGLMWGASGIYLTGIPFLGVVLCAKIFARRKAYGEKVASPRFVPGKPSI
ncbi:MAG: hypothetical protein ACOZFS_09425 [Thermodesulfobacteriota bacterium]